MKKLIKVIAVLIALVVVILLAGTVLLHIYLPPEKAKKLVLEHLSAQLKREVKLGSVSVGILSGLHMTDLKISESPNFSKGTFLSSEQFSLKIALMPLVFRKVIVRQIILKKPAVAIIRYADGKTFNFSDLTASTTAPSSTPHPAAAAATPSPTRGEGKTESLPFLLLVSRAEIDGGAVHFVDRSPAHQSIDIAPFDLILKNVSLTSPFSVQTSMQIKSKGSTLALNFAGDANLLDGSFNIKQGSLTSEESKVTVTGKLSGLKSAAPVVDLNIEIPQLKIANFKGFVALPPSVHIDKPLKGHIDLSGDEKLVNVSLNIALGAMSLSGHGKIQNLTSAQPTIGLHLESNSFPIEEILAYAPGSVPAGVSLKGNNKVSADVSGTQANAQFSAKWDGSDVNVTQGDNFTKAAGLPMELSVIGQTAGPNKIIVKTLDAKLLSNHVLGSGTYETKGTQGIIAFTAKGTNWSVPDLAKVSPLAAPYHPTGTLSFELHVSGPSNAPQTSVQTSADIAMADIKQDYYEGKNLQMKWNLTQVTPDLSKVSGTASLKQGPGKIMNVDKLAASSRLGKIALGPLDALAKLQSKGLFKQVNLPSLQSIPFDSIVGDYLLRSGIMEIKTFNLNGQDLSVQDTGTVGLSGAQAMNMKAVMKLAAGSVGGTLGNILQDENGRPTIKYTITGTLSNPDAKPDLQETGKRAAQEVGKELLKNQNVKDAVDGLQNSLKNIFH